MMDKIYDHQKQETKIYTKWEKSGAFKASGKGQPYTILMPPPNANASLHAGHAMYTIDDIIIRWKRMQGNDAVWIPGMDHAGFETQFVYEKQLAKMGKSRLDFDRNTLYQNIFDFVKENSGLIYEQFKRLGFSADWSRSVFTLDRHVINRVYETFKKLALEGKVYRDDYIVNYCTHCGTSLSELESNHVEREDKLYYIRYGDLTVATVRPETMYGDTAVAINPKDKRYKKLSVDQVSLPLTTRIIPIIQDSMVDPDFGTGAVKITPAHDPNDFEAGIRHKLESYNVIDLNGKMNLPEDVIYNAADGLSVKKAREITVAELQKQGYLEKIESYSHNVIICYKCGRDLEPTIVPNWFIKVRELKKPVINAVKEDRVRFYPKRYKKQMLNWLDTMHDWPISRQIVWGIRIPVWYEVSGNENLLWVKWLDEKGQSHQGNILEFYQKGISISRIRSGLQKLTAEAGKDSPKYVISESQPGPDFLPETDTFDTWFSSGQWPLVTIKDNEGDRLPTDFMGTLSDILSFWVSRMMMFTLYIKDAVPYKDVYLWSMVADAKGIKMSKSKGNVVNPIDLVNKYGADALRMTLIYGTPAGSRVNLSEDKVRGMRNFSNKIWNSARFITSDPNIKVEDKIADVEFANNLESVSTKVTGFLQKYQLSYAADLLYEKFWHWYCDECIEKSKNNELSKSDLLHGLIIFLKLLHPFMPFVTEAVWNEIGSLRKYPDQMLINSNWPN